MKYLNYLIILTFYNCSSSKLNNIQQTIEVGTYTTMKLNKLEKLNYSKKYDSDFFHFYEIGLTLNKDSTFHIVFCNRKISAYGNWFLKNDSINLINIIRTKNNIIGTNMKHLTKDGLIFFNYNGDFKSKVNKTTLLKIGNEIFDGITIDSNFNVKDSLKKYL